MNKLIILFGEMGSGKSYIGTRMAKEKGYKFLEGDSLATPEMINRISKFKMMDLDMIKSFIIDLTIKIEEYDGENLIVSQALYREEFRDYIYGKFKYTYDIEFIWVKPGIVQNIKNLFNRDNALGWVYYWTINKPFFQSPTEDVRYQVEIINGKYE